MKAPPDRPTPKVNPSETNMKLARMNLPDSLAWVLAEIRRDLESLKTQNNYAMGELHKRLEHWSADLRAASHSDIEAAILAHLAECHANGHA